VAAKKKKTPNPGNVTGLGMAGLATAPVGQAATPFTPRPAVLGAPPVGTYDPIIDYNAGAAQRGFNNTSNDAQTTFEQGKENYGIGLGDITRGRDRSLFDLGTSETRLNQDYGFQTSELGRNYGILGRQQAEGAAQRGVTSAGLLGKSAAVRSENQGREQGQLDLGHNRGLEDIGTQRTRVGEDFTRDKLGLDLGNARTFGGFNGEVINNPLTGAPQIGSLLTGVTRAGVENNAYQTAADQQRIGGAQSMGYVSPLLQSAHVGINGQMLNQGQVNQGVLVEGMIRDIAKREGRTVEDVARGVGIDPKTWQKI
jgi:hypothetical protein